MGSMWMPWMRAGVESKYAVRGVINNVLSSGQDECV